MTSTNTDNRPQAPEVRRLFHLDRLKPWHADLFAIAATATTLGVRLSLADQLKDRPTLVAFTVPIILSAYLGGLRAGLLATTLSYFGASYYLLPPFRSFYLSSTVDRWDVFFLVLAGVAISVLNEALHRARRRAAIATRDLQARVALVKAEALQSAIFNSTGFASIATDEKGVIQIFNVGAERMLGYTAAEMMHKLTPADIADPQEMIARAQALSAEFGTPIAPGLETLVYKASRGLEYVYEPTLIRKDGSRFPAVVSVAALRDDQGAIIGYLLIGTDNTARREAEEAKQISEARYRTLFEYAPDGIVIADANNVYLDVNPSICRMLGYTRDELIGLHASDIVAPEEIPHIGAALGVINAKAPYERQWKFRRKDGSLVAAEVLATLMPDGNLMGVVRDITERKRADARFHRLMDSNVQGVIFWNAAGQITEANDGFLRMVGCTREDLLAGRLDWSKMTPPEYADLDRRSLLDLASTGICNAVEKDFIRKDGTRVPVMIGAATFDDDQSQGVCFVLDRTENRRAQDALRKSETQLQTIIENISEAVVVSDLNGQLLHFNQAALDMLGYATLEEGLRHFTDLATTHELSGMDGTPWSVDQWPLARILRGEKLHDLEARMRRIFSESERIYSFGGTIAHDAGGKPLMAVVTFSDITERQQAEATALQLAAIVESSSDAVIGKDLHSIVTSWNEAAEKMFGYSAAEMIGQPIMRIIPPNHHDDEELILSHIRRGERMEHFETERLSKDGGLVFVSVTVSPIKDAHGRIIGASKVVRDITGRKRIEVELRESEERFRLLVVGVREYAIILLDCDGRVVSWNAGAERLEGYKAEEIIGKSLSVFYPPEDVAAGKPAMELNTATEQGKWEDEGWRVRADGTRFWANVLITALKDDSAHLRGFSKLTRDVTERKQAEEALLKAGALQRAIFNSANFSSIATDAKGVIQIFNVGAERMLGYSASEVMNQITPADISDPQEVIERAEALSLELETPITPGFEALVFKASRGIEDIYELTYVRKDGSRCPAVVSVTALRDAQDAIIGYLLIGTDNTARKQAEEALLKAGALQRAIFNSANFSSIATDAKGVIQIFNVGAERMLGYTAAEVMNKITPADISDPQEVIARAEALSLELGTAITPGFEALAFKASRGIEDIYQLTYIRKDGSRFPALVSVTALRDARDAIIGYLLIGTDNTARKQVDDALRKSEAQLQTIIENISEAVIVSDLDGQLVHFNPAALEMLGYFSMDEGRHHFSELAATHEFSGMEGTPWSLDQWPLARILRGEKLHDVEAHMRRIFDDAQRVCSFGGTIAHDACGKPLMAVITFSDITERKNAEAALETHRLAVETANHALALKNVQLSDLYQTAQRFMDDVSHEFRTPLSVIKGYSELMHADLVGPQSTEQKRFCQIIIDRARDMAQMVDDLLDSSKLRAGSLRVDRKPCEVADIFSALHPIIDSRVAASNIEWVEQIEADLPQVFADAEKATRVLVNLVINAIKFSPEGSRIILSAKATPNGDIQISVIDQGPGISLENLAIIFQRFKQVGNAIASAKGFGLGLSIARELVALNLGEITVASNVEKGSTFSFTLPLNDPEILLTRLFKRLETLDTPPGALAVLRVIPQHTDGRHRSTDILRGYLASSSHPGDLIMSSMDCEDLLLVGYSEKPAKWHQRLVAAGRSIEQFTPAQKLCTFEVELVEVLPYPAPVHETIAIVLKHLHQESIHV
jgi:PAS domain S-box-containing protein